jgi:hypothetical protein
MALPGLAGGDANRQQALTLRFDRRSASPPRPILKASPAICQCLKNQLFIWLSCFHAPSNSSGTRQNVEAAEAGREQAEARYRDTVTFRNSRSGPRSQKKFRKAWLV